MTTWKSPSDPPGTLSLLRRSEWLSSLAWLPVPILLLAIIAARAAGLNQPYEFDSLRLVLSFMFYTLASLGTVYLIGRSFLESGLPGLLLLECGVVLWSLAGTVGDAVAHGNANVDVAVFNLGILLAGMCHLAGAILTLRPRRKLRAKRLWLAAGCTLALATMGLITWAVLADQLPVFFVQGKGGTPVRTCVLISAVAMFVCSAGLLLAGPRADRSIFTSWYARALLLLAVGLFGIMVQVSLGSVVNWLSRTAQWLGGVYLFIAALASLPGSEAREVHVGETLREARYRYGVAVAIVVSAAAVRLTFLRALGAHASFVTFYPAVILAALYGGLRAGLLATALSALLASYLWIEPRGLLMMDPTDWLAIVVFVASAAMISWIIEAMRRAQSRAAAAEAEARFATERSRAEEAARAAHQRVVTMLESITDCYYALDGEWRFTQMNHNAARYFGVQASDVLGRAFRDVFPQIDGSVFETKYREAMRDGVAVHFETPSAVKTGSWVEVNVYPSCEGLFVYFLDVTERKRTEQALRESEERLRSLGNNLPASAVYQYTHETDGTPRFLYISAGIEQLLGVKAEDVLRDAATLHERILPDCFRALVEAEATSKSDLSVFDMEIQMRHIDGQVRWMHLRSRPRRLEDGRVIWDGVQTDVTQRKRAEEDLRKLNRTLRALSSSNQSMLRATDEKQYVQEVCQIIVRDCGHRMAWVGYARQDEDRTVEPVACAGVEEGYLRTTRITWADTERGRGPTGTSIRTGQAVVCNDFGKAPSFGPWRQEAINRGYASSVSLPLIAEGKAFGALMIYSDQPAPFSAEEVQLLTELVEDLAHGIGMLRLREAHDQAERALRQWSEQLEQRVNERTAELAMAGQKVQAERQRFLDVLETLPVIVALFRPDHRMVWVNRAYRDALGDTVGQLCYAGQFGRNKPCEECQAFRPLQSGRPHQWEWTLPNGRTFDIHNFPFADIDGSPMILEMDIDITARRQAEAALAERTVETQQRSEQLRALAAQLTEAEQKERQRLATLLHDGLQQLLVGTKFHVGVLRGELTNPQQQEMLKEVDDLLDESLDASRSLTVDLSPPILQHGTMAQVFQWLAKWFASKHGLVVNVHAEEKAHPQSPEIRTLLFQVVRELLFNAVKHARVGRACVELTCNGRGQIKVVVSDEGAGFDPSQPRSDRNRGSGFGLFSIQERLDWLGGSFQIQSAPGKGTRATILAPMRLKTTPEAVPAALEIAAPVARAARGGNGKAATKTRVLLADDHAVVRDGLSGLLQRQADLEVVGQAADGRQAVELALQLQPDVVVMDVNMPELDGKEATREILARLPNTRIIGLSMFAEADVAEAMKVAGAVDYLAKTSGPDALIAAIRRCGSSAQAGPSSEGG